MASSAEAGGGRDHPIAPSHPIVRWGPFLVAILLATAYLPAVFGDFLWDDDVYVTENDNLRNLDGLWRIWSQPTTSPQYYPLVFTTFWLEHHLWGLNPIGYHIVNVILHAVVAWLLWRVLLRIGVPYAGWAAAIFALHPVHVESVAWITERKNVLSGIFYLLALWVHVARSDPVTGSWWRRHRDDGLILVLYLCALLSKTATCALPVVILLIDWWKGRRIGWKSLARCTPLFILGVLFGILTLYLERTHVGTEQLAWNLTISQRCVIAGRAFWFYLAKLLWPSSLSFTYPRWEIDPRDTVQFLWPATVVVLLLSLWFARRRWGRGPLAAFLFFLVTLAPVLGFINVFVFRYSFVADHFQYLASIGPIALIVATVSRMLGAGNPVRRASWFRPLPGFALLVLLATLTFTRAIAYIDPQALWEDTLQKNPRAWAAHQNLGVLLDRQGKTHEAIAHFRTAIQLYPENSSLHVNLAIALFKLGEVDEALRHYQIAVERNPDSWMAQYNLGAALAGLDRDEEAQQCFRKALELKPNLASAAYNLGILAEKADRDDEALQQFQLALKLQPDLAPAHFRLARVLFRQGDRAAAASHLREFLRRQPDHPQANDLLRKMEGPPTQPASDANR